MQLACLLSFVCIVICWARVNASPASADKDESPTERYTKLLQRSLHLDQARSFKDTYRQFTLDLLDQNIRKSNLLMYPNSEQRRVYLEKIISDYENKYLLGKPQEQSSDLKYLLGKPQEQSSDQKYLLGKPQEQSSDLKYLLGKPQEQSSDLKYLLGKPQEQASDQKYLLGKLQEQASDQVLPQELQGESDQGESNRDSRLRFRDLFFRSYTKTVEKEEPRPGFLDRLYILCTKIPIIGRFSCPTEDQQTLDNSWTRYDNVWTNKKEPSLIFVEDTEKLQSKKSETVEFLQTLEKNCTKGTYLPELDKCILYVDEEMSFIDAKKYCEDNVDGGSLWLSNTNAQIADEILIANRIVEEKYSAWIDATYLSGTLAGTGNFDSDYKMWLQLGQVRGKPSMRDKITLSGNEFESFYTYVDEDELHSFICQSVPWSNE